MLKGRVHCGEELLVKTLPLQLLLLIGCAGAMFSAEPTALRKAPELAYKIPGQGDQLLTQYRGKVVALEFIKTTCPHCQAASRLMTQLQQQYGARGFQALDLAINVQDEGQNETQSNLLVATFTQTYHVGFPVGWVTRDQFLQFMGFSIMDYTVVPQLVIIDRRGDIRYQTPPRGDAISMKEETIRQRLEELLAEPVPTHNSGKRSTVAKRQS